VITRYWRWLLLLLLLGITPGGQAAPGAACALGSHTATASSEQAVLLLPMSFTGAALILLGLAFMIAEVVLPNYGIAGFVGLIALMVGALSLIDTDAPGFSIPLAMIVTLALLSVLLIATVLGMALKARRRALVSGDAGLVGSQATVTQVMAGNPFSGVVLAQGEQWQVQCATPLQVGQSVRVTARHGVMLEVSAAAPAVQGE